MNDEKKYQLSNSLIAGVLLLVLGILLVFGRDHFYVSTVHLIVSSLFLIGLALVIQGITQKEKRKELFLSGFLNMLFSTILSFFPKIPLSIVPIVFSIYLICNAIIKGILFAVLSSSKGEGRFKELFLCLVYLLFGVPLLFSPVENMNSALVIIGFYFIMLSSTYIIDFISGIVPNKYKNKLKRKIRITMPVVLEALIPYGVLTEINNFLSSSETKEKINYELKKQEEKPDMEIFVHTSLQGFNRIGHVDIYFDGKVMSYGNYDDYSKKLFKSVGDGVFFITEKEPYIPFCITEDRKTIFGFGLRLTEEQKINIRLKIEEIKELLVPWESPYESAKKLNEKATIDENDDYASKLYFETHAKMYKFTKGRFKKFFVLGNNCCLLADRIIGKSGTDILKINGIITPGTYYDYLNKEYYKKDSFVISRTIYNEEFTKEKPSFKKFWEKKKRRKEYDGTNKL